MKNILPLVILLFFIQACDTDCNCDLPEEPLECNLIYPGFWTTDSDCAYGTGEYTMTINESNDCISTTIYNFLNEGEIITIEFGSVSIIIPDQQLVTDRYRIYGSGFLESDTMRLTFTIEDLDHPIFTELCELRAIKE